MKNDEEKKGNISIEDVERLLFQSKQDLDVEEIFFRLGLDIYDLSVDEQDTLEKYGNAIVSEVITTVQSRLAFMVLKKNGSESEGTPD